MVRELRMVWMILLPFFSRNLWWWWRRSWDFVNLNYLATWRCGQASLVPVSTCVKYEKVSNNFVPPINCGDVEIFQKGESLVGMIVNAGRRLLDLRQVFRCFRKVLFFSVWHLSSGKYFFDQYEVLVNVLLQPESSQEKDVMSTPNIARNIILSDK